MESLGINLKYFLFQLLNFMILVGGLSYLLHKPLIGLIDKRKKEIAESLANAEKIKKELTETEQRQKAVLEKARSEASQLIEQAKEQADLFGKQLQEDSQAKADRLFAKAQEEIENQRQQLRTEMRQEMTQLVVEASRKVVGEAVTQPEKQAQIHQLVSEVSKQES